MRDVIAVCQTMPGPLAVQVAIFVGYLRCGSWGAWASGWALIMPASLMVALLAAAYVHLNGLPWLTAIIYGVSPAVIALILQSWWRLVRLGMEDRFQYVIATVSVVATLVLPGLLTAMFLAAGGDRRRLVWPASTTASIPVCDCVIPPRRSYCSPSWRGSSWLLAPSPSVVASPWCHCLQKGLVQQGHWLTPH